MDMNTITNKLRRDMAAVKYSARNAGFTVRKTRHRVIQMHRMGSSRTESAKGCFIICIGMGEGNDCLIFYLPDKVFRISVLFRCDADKSDQPFGCLKKLPA